jgi:cytochrome c peroxidase
MQLPPDLCEIKRPVLPTLPNLMRRALFPIFLLLLQVLLLACKDRPKGRVIASREVMTEQQPFMPLPPRASLGLDPRRVELGRRLFEDTILSGDEKVSCVSCHLQEKGLSNGQKYAELPTRPRGTVNVPTLYNVVYNYRYNWDGRFLTLESQLDALIEKKGAMGSSWAQATGRLGGHKVYGPLFRQAYADGVTPANVRGALIDYMTSLTTPGARFDRWLLGDESALSEDERKGYRLFNSYGCSSCHQGRNIGGNMLQQFGIIQEGIIADYFKSRGKQLEATDHGYGNFTGQPEDDFFFRVPSLRNVTETAPYFHDGGAATLEEAVRVMGRVQLGREFEPWELGLLVAFLGTLRGEISDGAPR